MIWKELADEIKRQGMAQITIFERDPVLFRHSELRDEAAWDRLLRTRFTTGGVRSWTRSWSSNDDGIVDSNELREVFNLEANAH